MKAIYLSLNSEKKKPFRTFKNFWIYLHTYTLSETIAKIQGK